MKKKILWLMACLLPVTILLQAQTEIRTLHLPQGHPRYLTDSVGRQSTRKLIEDEPWAAEVYRKLEEKTAVYVRLTTEQPDWLFSRLAMYWHSHATEIYVKGETFDHAGGIPAPVPTVRYTGTRGTYATHSRPKLEDVVPYDDDAEGNVTFHNNSLPGRPLERVHPSKTGRNIESLNREIMGIARNAAFLYWLNGDTLCARLAAGVFDTYMQGIYYRDVPVDLNHGHQQTLVGMSSFEVIHEDILYDIIPLYDFLYAYLAEHYTGKMAIYAAALKKWAENIIANGVPHNNWNLMQARYVTDIALVLEDDACYPDGKGRGYYLDYVLNRSGIRQWSLKQLAAYGYDPQTGIWAECPGYSSVVLNDYTAFVSLFDRNLHRDLTADLPVLPLAVAAMPQYLFPNRMICGFGDTHPDRLKTAPAVRMIENARAHDKVEQEVWFTALLKCLDPDAGKPVENSGGVRPSVNAFFDEKPLLVDPAVPAGQIEDYVSPLFHAPNVSWLVQRNGMNPRHSLMVSLNGSEGNHAHANGISMELYGKGYVLGPDAGIGEYLYSGLDYAEYYSQFPSHNTVCVDGISSYPVMKSNHAFEVLACFPAPSLAPAVTACTDTNGDFPVRTTVSYGNKFPTVTYSNLYFREPESRADQLRLTGIVTTGSETGYYIDIFRSRKEQGGDKMHDYFYHNLGQEQHLHAADGTELNLQPTEELAFAGAHLYAYSYLFDKKCARTAQHVKSVFTMQMPDGDDIRMNLWMKGEEGRTLFSALSPMTEGLSRTPGMPYNIKQQPTLTFVARQEGEAWNRPFVAVYEPSSQKEPEQITSVSFPQVDCPQKGSHVGIRVEQRSGRTDYILSSDNASHLCTMDNMEARAVYALWGETPTGCCTFFLGNGTLLKTPATTIKATTPVNVLLEKRADGWYCTASGTCNVTIGKKTHKVKATATESIRLF